MAYNGTLYFERDVAPPTPGDWQFVYARADPQCVITPHCPRDRYFASIKGEMIELARSAPFAVRAPTVTLRAPNATGGRAVTPPALEVGVHTSPGHSTYDWLGVARRGGAPNVTGVCRGDGRGCAPRRVTGGACTDTKGCWQYVPASPTGTVMLDERTLPRCRGVFDVCYLEEKGYVVCGFVCWALVC